MPDPGDAQRPAAALGRLRLAATLAWERLWERLSLSTKLIGALVVAFAVVFLLVHWISNSFEDSHYDLLSQRTLSKAAEVVVESIRWDAAGRPVAVELPPDLRWLPAALQDDLDFRIEDRDGRVLIRSPGQAHGNAASAVSRKEQDGTLFRSVSVAVGTPDNPYTLHLNLTDRLLHLLRTQVISWPTALITTVLGLVAVTLIVLLAVRRLLRPLHDASDAAATISSENLHRRLSTEGVPVEIRPLITAFNQALGRLEHGFRIQQEFLASAAHELKTPLALIRGQIELERDFASRDLLLKDIDLMARQVHQLLHLAELSEIQNYRFEQVDLCAVALDLVGYMERKAVRSRTSLELLLPDLPVYVMADASAVFILFRNLIENAIAHSSAGGEVTVSIANETLQVIDRGPGIAAADVSRLFTRFWRGSARAYEGAGLGLSICQEIVLAHRWSIDVRDASPGACFTITFG